MNEYSVCKNLVWMSEFNKWKLGEKLKLEVGCLEWEFNDGCCTNYCIERGKRYHNSWVKATYKRFKRGQLLKISNESSDMEKASS